MSRPIEQALANLIPRHSGVLPAELIELANSLLAQSRNKCSNLKPDEEVARVYASANLACERLKTSLNLPPIEPRPPIPPRVYGKLYAYFDRTLVTSGARKRALQNAAKSNNNNSSSSSNSARTPVKALPQRLTPSRAQSLSGFQSQRSAKRGLLFPARRDKEGKVPKWVGPVVRLLCREMGTRKAVPHVLAGVESILCLPCPKGEGAVEGKVPALVAMVWFFVVLKMRGPEGRAVEGVKRTERVREVLRGAREDGEVRARLGERDEAWTGWEEVKQKDVNAWRGEIVEKGWRELDWWTNIEEGVGVDGEEEHEHEDEEMLDLGVEVVREIGRTKPRTMIQEQFCVNDAKRAEFQAWKEALLVRIAGISKDPGLTGNDDS
ncbi:uncharacterized protein L3040_001558 [Drepanopeziza brunnea f. sp. 'multigermtubi']|uniref:uncharacterized protein n=1 Tax=Drepanopeziza brunnea f. sp. 'multigermtubi' TaxID=698441 RepID=UPI0023823179|nr:hypothetical protein L3040_001558 [Drepanopeziza brunnea f. sp. 'multigermtubi']